MQAGLVWARNIRVDPSNPRFPTACIRIGSFLFCRPDPDQSVPSVAKAAGIDREWRQIFAVAAYSLILARTLRRPFSRVGVRFLAKPSSSSRVGSVAMISGGVAAL